MKKRLGLAHFFKKNEALFTMTGLPHNKSLSVNSRSSKTEKIKNIFKFPDWLQIQCDQIERFL